MWKDAVESLEKVLLPTNLISIKPSHHREIYLTISTLRGDDLFNRLTSVRRSPLLQVSDDLDFISQILSKLVSEASKVKVEKMSIEMAYDAIVYGN